MQPKNSPFSLRPRFYIPPRLALAALAFGAAVAFTPIPVVFAADDSQTNAQAASDNNSYRLFYDKLADDGDWFQTDDYGYVFQPRAATQDKAWRPYTDGYWAHTDAGWAWVSNEDFGWACYHYGRWANLVDTGWVWIPGADWSPAYVSWRVSKDHKHIGWAPLPPEARISKGAAIEGWVDSAYDVGPEAYTFIDTDHFNDDSYRTHLLPAEQTQTVFEDTENVTRIDYRTVGSQSVLYDGGPDVAIFRESGGRPVRELRLETRSENAEFFEHGNRRSFSEVNGGRLVVATAAPDVITSTTIRVNQPARINRRLDHITVNRGYEGIRDQQQVDRIRASVRSRSPRPPEQVEREANAAMRRNAPSERNNAANAPGERNNAGERNGQPGRNDPASTPPRPEGTPAGTPTREGSPSPANNRERPGASPATTPRRENAESPAPSREAGRNGRERPTPSPEATNPGATPHGQGKKPQETPAPSHENTPAEHNRGPQATPTPAAKGEHPDRKGEERNGGEHPRPSATPERAEQSPTPASRKHENATPERESTPAATPHRGAGEGREKSTEPAATPRREEPPASRTEGEKKTAPNPNANAGAPRRETERSAPAGEGRERANKPETAPSGATEKEKATPKP